MRWFYTDVMWILCYAGQQESLWDGSPPPCSSSGEKSEERNQPGLCVSHILSFCIIGRKFSTFVYVCVLVLYIYIYICAVNYVYFQDCIEYVQFLRESHGEALKEEERRYRFLAEKHCGLIKSIAHLMDKVYSLLWIASVNSLFPTGNSPSFIMRVNHRAAAYEVHRFRADAALTGRVSELRDHSTDVI